MNRNIACVITLLFLAFCVPAWSTALATPSFNANTFFRISNTTGVEIVCSIEYYNAEDVFLGPEPPAICTFALPAHASWLFNPVINDPVAEGEGNIIPDRPRTWDTGTTGTAVIKWLGYLGGVTVAPADNTAPVITLEGDNPLYITVGQLFADPGAVATDNFDGDVSSAIEVTGTVDAATVGVYELTYAVSDLAGNHASVTRTVYVQPVNGAVEIVEGGDTLEIDGLSILIPADALSAPATISLRPVSVPLFSLPANVVIVGTDYAYALTGFDAVASDGFITVTLGYADVDQDGVVDETSIQEEDLVVLVAHDSLQFDLLQGVVDATANTITVDIPRSLLSAKVVNDLFMVLGAETEPPVPLQVLPLLASVAALALWQLRRRG